VEAFQQVFEAESFKTAEHQQSWPKKHVSGKAQQHHSLLLPGLSVLFPLQKCFCKTILGFEEDLRAWTYDLHHVVSGFWGWTFGKCPTARRYFASLDGTWQQVIQIWRLLRSCKTHLTIISWVG